MVSKNFVLIFGFLGIAIPSFVSADNILLTKNQLNIEPFYQSTISSKSNISNKYENNLIERFINDIENQQDISEDDLDEFELELRAQSEIALIAMSYVGIKYKWGGVSPKDGFDCSGLIHYLFENHFDTKIPRSAYFQKDHGEKVAHKDLQTGDLVFFNTRRRKFSHVGIYIGDNKFLHSPRRGKTVSIDDMSKKYWHSRFNGARRIQIN